jgi:hypothetical protein
MLTTKQLSALIATMLAKGTSTHTVSEILTDTQTLLMQDTIEQSIARGFNAYYGALDSKPR